MEHPERSAQFTWNAKEYSSHSAFQEMCADELIAKLRLSGSEHVLDIGCGDGRVTAGIARRLPHGQVLGIDSSPEMVRYAQEHFPRDKFPNLSFCHLDARALGFKEEFDVIFSNAALHWVMEPRPVLDGIYHALQPGGRMVVQMAGKGNAAEAFLAFAYLAQDPPWNQYFCNFHTPYAFFGSEQYRELVIGSGLLPVRVELIRRDMVHIDRESFAGWVRTTWLPYLGRVPVSLQPAFIEALYAMSCTLSPPDSRGALHIRMVRLEAEAEKKV
ncbi:MAG: methyltransferase domain-containing protein [Methanoregula sp.]|jgi:trans-aconitate methyltransferase|nr:methyltransferase domain-containing protein [Methanoregula sp.]